MLVCLFELKLTWGIKNVTFYVVANCCWLISVRLFLGDKHRRTLVDVLVRSQNSVVSWICLSSCTDEIKSMSALTSLVLAVLLAQSVCWRWWITLSKAKIVLKIAVETDTHCWQLVTLNTNRFGFTHTRSLTPVWSCSKNKWHDVENRATKNDNKDI